MPARLRSAAALETDRPLPSEFYIGCKLIASIGTNKKRGR